MKTNILIALPLILSFALVAPAEAKKKAKAAPLQTTVLKIEQTSRKPATKGQAAKLRKSAMKIKGVASVRVDRTKGTLTIKSRGPATEADIDAAVARAGFIVVRPKAAVTATPEPGSTVPAAVDDDGDEDDEGDGD